MIAKWTPWLIAAGGTAVATAAGYAMQLNPNTMGFAYLIVVLFSALRGGFAAGAAASIVATLFYNFFFFDPLHTFTIAEPSNWITLAAFLITSVIVSRLVIAAQTEAERSDARTQELETLYRLSVELLTATGREGAVGETTGRALTLLGARGGGLIRFDGSPWNQKVIWWSGERPDTVEDVVAGIGRHGDPIEIPSSLGRDVYLPLTIAGETAGALIARGTAASLHALVSASGLIALAVERETFLDERTHIQAIRESDMLKTSLLRAISHDLTTPLTSITIHTAALRRRTEQGDEELQEAVEGIAGETSRLRRRIDNLLSMARLEAGKAHPRREPTPPADLFRAVRENLPLVFQQRPVNVSVSDDCPDAQVDPSLILEVLINLVENAHRVSPSGSPIDLTAEKHPSDAGAIRIEVRDRGPGIPPGVADEEGNLLPAARSDVAQRGLGLEIARTLTLANGGSVGLTSRSGGGAIARVDIPAAQLAAALETRER